MKDPTIVTREDVIRLSRSDPAVATCLMHWHQGTITFEQALISCVLILAEENKEQGERLIDIYSRHPSWDIFHGNEEKL